MTSIKEGVNLLCDWGEGGVRNSPNFRDVIYESSFKFVGDVTSRDQVLLSMEDQSKPLH